MERGAVVRGVVFPMTRWPANGKPEPPPGFIRIGRAPPGEQSHGRYIRGPSHGPPRQARGDPPGIPVDWGGCALHTYGRSSGPIPHEGTSNHGDPPMFETTTGPPGRPQHGRYIRGPSHGPPRQARGDPPGTLIDWGVRATFTYGHSSGQRCTATGFYLFKKIHSTRVPWKAASCTTLSPAAQSSKTSNFSSILKLSEHP